MHRVRVLIVDRYADHATTLRLLFESRGCVVFVAPDARAALDVIEAERPDALVIDLDTLAARGVCNAARAANALGALVVGIAGVGKDPCDCDINVLKPYRFDELAVRMDAFLGQRVLLKRAGNGGAH